MVQTQQATLKNLTKLPNIFWGGKEEDVLAFVHRPQTGKIPQGQFSLVQEEENAIYLIRDRLGLNKLFYCIDPATRTVTAANYLFEVAEKVKDKETIFSVPAGHYLRIDKATLAKQLHCYYDISEQIKPDGKFDLSSFQKEVKDVLSKGFRYLKENFKDSEYFVCLSGGLDSTVILNYAKEFLAGRVKAVTFSYASAETIKEYGHVIVEPPEELFKDKALSEDFHRAFRITKLLGIPFVAVLIEKKMDMNRLEKIIRCGQDWRDFNVHCAWVNHNIAVHVQEHFPAKKIIFLTGDLMNEFVADYAAVDYKGVSYYPQPRVAKDRMRKFFVYGLDAGDRELGVFYSPHTFAIPPYALVAEIYLGIPGEYLQDPDAKQKLNTGLLFDPKLAKEVSGRKIRAQVGGSDGGTLGLFHDAGISEQILKEKGMLLSKFILGGRYRH